MKNFTAIIIGLFMVLFGNLYFNYNIAQYRNSADHIIQVVEKIGDFRIVPSTKQDVKINEKDALNIGLKSVQATFKFKEPTIEHVVRFNPGSTVGEDAWVVIFPDAKNPQYPNITFTIALLINSQTGELLDGIGFDAQQYENQ